MITAEELPNVEASINADFVEKQRRWNSGYAKGSYNEAKNNRLKYFMISCASIIVVILIWFICIDVLHLKSEKVFPGPVKVLKPYRKTFYTEAPDGATLLAHLWSSLVVALFGYFLGAVVGSAFWGLPWPE